MASPLDICNSALIKLGARQITALTQDIKEARLCNTRYPFIRDMVLENGNWNFATKRAELAQLVTSPVWGFDYAFQIPADCLSIIDIEHPEIEWQEEGDTIVSNSSTMKIKYIRKEDNVSLFTPMFVEGLALALAWDLSYPILQSGTQTDFWRSAYEAYMQQVRSKDAQTGTPYKLIDSANDVFLNSRY